MHSPNDTFHDKAKVDIMINGRSNSLPCFSELIIKVIGYHAFQLIHVMFSASVFFLDWWWILLTPRCQFLYTTRSYFRFHTYIVPLSFFSREPDESIKLTDGSVRNLITTSSFLSIGCRTTALINRDNPLRRFSRKAESPTERRCDAG